MRDRGARLLVLVAVFAAVCCNAIADGDTGHVVALERGLVGNHQWLSTVTGSSSRMRSSVPCDGIAVRDLRDEGKSAELEFGEGMTTVCKAVNKVLPPIVLSVGIEEGTAREGAIFAILAAPQVVRVRLFMGRGGVRNVPLRLLKGKLATDAKVPSVRYAAFGKLGSACVTRIVSFNRDGGALFRSAFEAC